MSMHIQQTEKMNSSKSSANSFKEYIEGIKEGLAHGGSPLEVCAGILTGEQPMPAFMESLPPEEMYYWVGNVYTSVIPKATKKELAAYFTPPRIARYTITRAEELGFKLTSSRII